jgi:hypothetical protein
LPRRFGQLLVRDGEHNVIGDAAGERPVGGAERVRLPGEEHDADHLIARARRRG